MFGNNLQSQDIIVSWKLAGKINTIYHDIVNNDIIKPSYSDVSRPDTFWLIKRKAYKNILANSDYSWWEFTDVNSIPVGKCWDQWNNLFFYVVSPWRTEAQILKAFESSNWDINCISQPIFDKPFCHCECQASNFIKVKWPRWDRRTLPNGTIKSENWIQINKLITSINEQEGRFGDNWWTADYVSWNFWTDVKAWDYIYVYCSENNSDSAISWQIRKIIWYDSVNKQLILDYPRNLVNNVTSIQQIWYDAEYMIFSEWWEVLVYATCNWLKIIHPDESWYNISSICSSEVTWDTCITSLNYHNGQIHYTNDRWRDVYSEKWYNQFAFESNNFASVPASSFNQVSFRNHLVYFGSNFTGVLYPTQSNSEVYASVSLSDTVWLWSKDSFFADENALMVINSDKRLKAISIQQTNWTDPQLITQDITEYFNWDLDRLKKWDKVYISKVWTELRIHIIGRQLDDWAISTWDRTKILILDTHFWVYHKHTVCNAEVTKYLWHWLYWWSGIFTRCGYQDWWFPSDLWVTTSTNYYTQLISTFLWDNWNNSVAFDTFNPKKLKYLKTMLWPSILTDGDSEVRYISYRNWYKAKRVMQDRENIKWIDDQNKIKQWLTVEIDECTYDDLLENQNIEDECEYGLWDINKETLCNCPTEIEEKDDYCVCYKDRWYFLSNIYPVEIKEQTKLSDLIKVEWRATMWNIMYFMWFMAQLEVWQSIDDIYDNNTLENIDCKIKSCNNKKCI